LLNYPVVHTSYNDVIFNKKEGIILNRKMTITIEKSSSIDKRFNQLLKTQATTRFAKTITQTINIFERQNKQELVRLTKALAVKFANSKDFAKKQNIVNSAKTSTDVLNTLINLVK